MARRTTDQRQGQPELAAPASADRPVGGRATTAVRKDPLAAELGRRGGLKGGKARAAKLSPERRRAIAQKAAALRWGRLKGETGAPAAPRAGGLPSAARRGRLRLAEHSLECFVLADGRRLIGLWSAAAAIAGVGAGELADRLQAAGLTIDLQAATVVFNVPDDWRLARAIDAPTFVAICRDLSSAGRRAPELAARAQLLLADCALDGLRALIDAAAEALTPATPPL